MKFGDGHRCASTRRVLELIRVFHWLRTDTGAISIELPALAETERRAVWTHAPAEANLEVADLDALAARQKIGPGVVRRAVAAARGTEDVNAEDASPAIKVREVARDWNGPS